MCEELALSAWSARLEQVCSVCPRLGVVGVRVLAETGSTQDAAWAASGGEPGWLVVAGQQTGGRGRLGRVWADGEGRGLAMSLTFRAGMVSSVQVGVAVCRAVNELVVGGRAGGAGVAGLRWPNDVVEREGRGEGGRKIAGVLIEVREGVAMVGIGVNVLQQQEDFAGDLAGRAVSIVQLGGRCRRLDVACRVLEHLDRVFGMDAEEVVREAMALDTLVGTHRRFVHDGREYAGRVVGLGADDTIDLVLDDGRVVELPGATTSLVPG